MKLDDFTMYNRCLDLSSQLELEELSRNAEYEERYMRFLRYVEILEEHDTRKIEGKKLIERIYDLDKFK